MIVMITMSLLNSSLKLSQVLLTTTHGWESVMRVRCSAGMQVQQFHGNLNTENDLIVFPVIDATKAMAVRLKVDNIDIAKNGSTCILFFWIFDFVKNDLQSPLTFQI